MLFLALSACTGDDATGDQDTVTAEVSAAISALDEDRAWQDLTWLASQTRSPGSQHWQATQDHCADVLEGLGFDVTRHDFGIGTNVVGMLEGATDEPAVLVTAHYDSVAECPGADDNASGVAGALEIARLMAGSSWNRDLIVACWDQEENGLLGAEAWASEHAASISIAVNYNLEMIAYSNSEPDSQHIPLGFDYLFEDAYAVAEEHDFAGDFIAAVGDEYAATEVVYLQKWAENADARLAPLVVEAWLKDSEQMSDLRRSDHAVFWGRDVPAIMVTDTSEFRYDSYHCRDGTVDELANLDRTFFEDVIATVAGAVGESLYE